MELSRTSGRLEAFYQRYVHQDDIEINPDTFDSSQYDEQTLLRVEEPGHFARMTNIGQWWLFQS